jgi:hypothetical protein
MLKMSQHWGRSSYQQGPSRAQMLGANSSTGLPIVIHLVSMLPSCLVIYFYLPSLEASKAMSGHRENSVGTCELKPTYLSSMGQEVLLRTPWGRLEPVRRPGQTRIFWLLCSARITAWNRSGFYSSLYACQRPVGLQLSFDHILFK